MKDSKRQAAERGGGARQKLKDYYVSVKPTIQILSQVVLLIFLLDSFGVYGAVGFICVWAIYGAYRLYLSRDMLIIYRNSIEAMLFGKPLDKGMWNKGELKALNKKRKIKFVWRKKKHETKD